MHQVTLSSIPGSPSVSLVEGRPSTTSLDIAVHFGKQHKDVLKSIRNLCADLPDDIRQRNFALTFRTVAGPNNSERQEEFFTVYFDGFILLVMGYTGKKALTVKLAYIAAFNSMREELERQSARALPEPVTLTPSTVTDREPLRAIVNAWSRICGQPQNNLWPQVRAAFNIVNIKELPAEWVPDAIAWVQAKIDALPPAPEPLALPATPAFLDERIQTVQAAVSEVQERGSAFISSIFALQSAMRRPVKTDPGVGELAKALERTLPNFGTAIGMNVSALSELLDVYGATLTAGH